MTCPFLDELQSNFKAEEVINLEAEHLKHLFLGSVEGHCQFCCLIAQHGPFLDNR